MASSMVVAGTVTYMAPELLSQGKLTKAGDVYSFGVISESLNRFRQGQQDIVSVTSCVAGVVRVAEGHLPCWGGSVGAVHGHARVCGAEQLAGLAHGVDAGSAARGGWNARGHSRARGGLCAGARIVWLLLLIWLVRIDNMGWFSVAGSGRHGLGFRVAVAGP
jgi:hypothetical protein